MTSPGENLHANIDGDWLLPEPAQRLPIHTRSILCRSFRLADGSIELDGRFIDTRPFAYDNDFRGHCEAGSALHTMQLRLTLDPQRLIVAVQAAMPRTPFGSCPEVLPHFQRLAGLSIGRGFKAALRDRLGGIEGCTHVIALLEVMAATAMQAFASNNFALQSAGLAAPQRVWPIAALENTCHGYRSDGPVIKRLREQIAQATPAAS